MGPWVLAAVFWAVSLWILIYDVFIEIRYCTVGKRASPVLGGTAIFGILGLAVAPIRMPYWAFLVPALADAILWGKVAEFWRKRTRSVL